MRVLESDRVRSYRSQKGVHEFVHLCGLHQILTLQDSHRKPGNDGQVFLKVLADKSAVTIVIFYCPNVWKSSEHLESLVIQFIYVGDMRIRYNHVGQRLHIT